MKNAALWDVTRVALVKIDVSQRASTASYS
jgi:hypothetical protein